MSNENGRETQVKVQENIVCGVIVCKQIAKQTDRVKETAQSKEVSDVPFLCDNKIRKPQTYQQNLHKAQSNGSIQNKLDARKRWIKECPCTV